MKRRWSPIAVTDGLDVEIARELIASKLDGQRRNLVRLGADLGELDTLRAALESADSIDPIRIIEAKVAGLYFRAWRNVWFGSAIRTCQGFQHAGCEPILALPY